MKRHMICHIDLLADASEEAWFVSMDVEDVAMAVTYLCALRLGKVHTLYLLDAKTRKDASKQLQIHRDSEANVYAITYNHATISATNEWLDSVSSMLIEVFLNGWSQVAHIDQEFTCAENRVMLCIAVSPPRCGC